MPEAVPGVAVEPYYLESIVPMSIVAEPKAPGQDMSAVDTLSLYLLDLMALHGYRVVSGVRVEIPQPENVPYPKGWTVVRLIVDVQEFDVDVDPADA